MAQQARRKQRVPLRRLGNRFQDVNSIEQVFGLSSHICVDKCPLFEGRFSCVCEIWRKRGIKTPKAGYFCVVMFSHFVASAERWKLSHI